MSGACTAATVVVLPGDERRFLDGEIFFSSIRRCCCAAAAACALVLVVVLVDGLFSHLDPYFMSPMSNRPHIFYFFFSSILIFQTTIYCISICKKNLKSTKTINYNSN